MFKAMGKYLRATWYLMTFRVNKAADTLRLNPGVMSASYDKIIEENAAIESVQGCRGGHDAQEESKKARSQFNHRDRKFENSALARQPRRRSWWRNTTATWRLSRTIRVPPLPIGLQGFFQHPGREPQAGRGAGRDLKQLVANVGGPRLRSSR